MVFAGTTERTTSTHRLVELVDDCVGAGFPREFYCKVEQPYEDISDSRLAMRVGISQRDQYTSPDTGGDKQVLRHAGFVVDGETLLFLASVFVENENSKIERTGAARLLRAISSAISDGRIIEDEEV